MTAKAQRVAWLGPILAWVVLLCATAAVAWLGVEASGRLRFGGALAALPSCWVRSPSGWWASGATRPS